MEELDTPEMDPEDIVAEIWRDSDDCGECPYHLCDFEGRDDRGPYFSWYCKALEDGPVTLCPEYQRRKFHSLTLKATA